MKDVLKIVVVLLALFGLFSLSDLVSGNSRQKKALEKAYEAGYEAGCIDASPNESDDGYDKGYDDGYASAQENVSLWFNNDNWYYEIVFDRGFGAGYDFCLEDHDLSK